MPLTLEEFVGPAASALAAAFERFPFGVAVFAAVRDEDDGEVVDFGCVYVNSGLERTTGLPADRFVGHRLLEVVPSTPTSRRRSSRGRAGRGAPAAPCGASRRPARAR